MSDATLVLNDAVAIDEAGTVARLHIGLLRGFRVERAGTTLPDSVWQRRAAKSLTKLLATHRSHTLHREQILELLWPDVDIASGRNSFAKALHAARRAFEPERARGSSAYLHLRDDMLTLDTEHVLIDADQFQTLAERAFELATISAHETALAAYTGELLPEDRYEDWSAARREDLAEMRTLLLVGLAEKLEQGAAYSEAADRLRTVLEQDPAREDLHRRLIRLYAKMGVRGLAVRQFEICRDVLEQHLNIAPDPETEALYQDVLANRVQSRIAIPEPALKVIDPGLLVPAASDVPVASAGEAPLVGRDGALELLRRQLSRAEAGCGGTVLVSGEAGVGKSRLVAEFLTEVRGDGVSVLGDGRGGYASRLPYGTVAVALEEYLACRSEAERTELALRYPALTDLIPSLKPRLWIASPAERNGNDRLSVLTAIVRLLTDLAGAQSVVVALGDLHDAHSSSIELFEYLASLGPQRRWLLIGTFRDEAVEAGGELSRMIEAASCDQFCVHVELQPLARHHCDELARALLPGGVVEGALLDYLYTLSLGNPLFAKEIIREARERNELVLFRGVWRERTSVSFKVPARVRALMEMSLAALEAPVRRVLDLVAVGGPETMLADLHRAAAKLQPALSNADLLEALDQALDSRILVERRGGYAFRHPLVRAAVHEHLSHHRLFQMSAALRRDRGRPVRS